MTDEELAELQFDAKVALPEAQERFTLAEAQLAACRAEVDRLFEEREAARVERDRYRAALARVWAGHYEGPRSEGATRVAASALRDAGAQTQPASATPLSK